MAAPGDRLEITVIECKKLEKRWFSRKTYVELEYNGSKYKTEICKGRDKNPKFGDKFELDFVENLEEINVSVWGSKTHFIGSGRRIDDKKVKWIATIDCRLGVIRPIMRGGPFDFGILSELTWQESLHNGYHDKVCPLLTRSFRYAGETRVIMHYPNGINSSLRRAAAVFFSLVKIAGCFSF